jgi:hypothetical protein
MGEAISDILGTQPVSSKTERPESQDRYLSQLLTGGIDHCEGAGGSPVLRMARRTLDSEFMSDDDALHATARNAAPVARKRA